MCLYMHTTHNEDISLLDTQWSLPISSLARGETVRRMLAPEHPRGFNRSMAGESMEIPMENDGKSMEVPLFDGIFKS